MLTDYGKSYVSDARYVVRRPGSAEEAVQVWRDALARGSALRVRGSGHTMSGIALPRAGETLVLTRGLDRYRVEAPGRIVVESGAIVWDVRDFVADRGWQLPVYNGGWAGPSLGGFVSTGGMGGVRVPDPPAQEGGDKTVRLVSVSEKHGGFWANATRLVMIDGRGRVHDICAGDRDFPWIFASMGQFGLILKVTLRLLRTPGEADRLPAGDTGPGDGQGPYLGTTFPGIAQSGAFGQAGGGVEMLFNAGCLAATASLPPSTTPDR